MKTLSTLILVLTISFTFGLADVMAQPENDLIENAIDLGYGPVPYAESSVDFANTTNTNDNTPPGTGCGLSEPAVWYKFTATKSGSVGAGILLPSSPVVVFFEGPAEGVTSGMELFYVDQPNNTCAVGSTSSIDTTVGTTYYVYFKNDVASDIIINTANTFEVPENDLIENAIDLAQEPIFYEQDDIHILMATDTNDGGQMGCPSNDTAGIWYKITPTQEGEISALISGALGTTVGIFYSSENPNATSGEELTWVNQPNNPCAPNGEVLILAEEGLTYYLFVASLNPYIDIQINVSSVLGSEENTIEGFAFYPNPVTNELNISAKSTIDEVVVHNIMGQKVFSEQVNSTSKSVNLSFLQPGLYILNATSEGKTANFKIIKK